MINHRDVPEKTEGKANSLNEEGKREMRKGGLLTILKKGDRGIVPRVL